MKKVIVYSILFILSILTVYKSQLVYTAFQENNIPVYDGVTYEKKQIEQFERFKGNYSLWKKNTEFQYQMMINGVDAGFVSLLIYIAPEWLANDYDILVRSFLCLFIFSITLYSYLSYLNKKLFFRLGIIFIILQLPLFYNEKYGLSTYIAEIPSALLLLSGYISILIYFKNNKIINLILGILFMIVPVYFRLNFIVYSFLFFLPLILELFKSFLKMNFFKKVFILFFLITLLSMLGIYFIKYFDYFISYYVNPPVKWEGHGNMFDALGSFSKNYISQIGILGVLIIAFLVFKIKKNTFDKDLILHSYPFISLFILIIFVNRAVSVPHVVSALTVFSLLMFVGLNLRKRNYDNKYNYIFYLLFIIYFSITFIFDLNSVKKTLKEYEASHKVVKYILTDQKLDKDFKYICLFNDVAETPIDVAIYREKGIYLNSQEHFYYHNYGWFHKVDKGLDEKKCSDFISNKIDDKFYDLIVLNDKIDKDLLSFPLAKKVWKRIAKDIYQSKKYTLVHTEKTKLYGNLLFYRPN